MSKQHTLTIGRTYKVSALVFAGWTEGDGSGHEGYNVDDFFSAEGEYLGADKHGIEPVVDVGLID